MHLLNFYKKKFKKFFLRAQIIIWKNTFQKIAVFVTATTGASNNFGIEKLHFLRGVDTTNTPALIKEASRENIWAIKP